MDEKNKIEYLIEQCKLKRQIIALVLGIVVLIGIIIESCTEMVVVIHDSFTIVNFGEGKPIDEWNGEDIEEVEEVGVEALKNTEAVWKLIKIKFRTEKYEEVIRIAEENELLDTERMLNVIGVMYANGYYYEQDFEKAIQYFTAASEYGELDETFLNLWLASYEYDLALQDEYFPYGHTYEAVLIGQKKNNKKLNELLTTNAQIFTNKRVKDGYVCIEQMNGTERDQFLSTFNVSVGEHKYLVSTDYDYYRDEDNNVIAVVSRFEERSIPTRIYVKGSPSSYIVFENIDIPSEAVGEQAEVTGVFEYETSYLDKDGNICLWLDTDEIYYGNVPPADTENSRWVIMGYEDGEYEERRFRKQIKQ